MIEFGNTDEIIFEITSLNKGESTTEFPGFIYATEATSSRLFTSVYSLNNNGIIYFDADLGSLLDSGDLDDGGYDFEKTETTVQLSSVYRVSLVEDTTSPNYNYYVMYSGSQPSMKSNMGCVELYEKTERRVLQEDGEDDDGDEEEDQFTLKELGKSTETSVSLSSKYIAACLAISDPDYPEIPPIYLQHKTTTIADFNEIVEGGSKKRGGAIAFLSMTSSFLSLDFFFVSLGFFLSFLESSSLPSLVLLLLMFQLVWTD